MKNKIYKYNNIEEARKWDHETWRIKVKELNPDIICKIAEEDLIEFKKTDPKYFEQKAKYEHNF